MGFQAPFIYYGGCVLPRQVVTGFSNVLPYCNGGQVLWPDGCLDLTLSQAQCTAAGGTYKLPSFDGNTCLADAGCTTYVTGYLFNSWFGTENLQAAVNGYNKGNCSACDLSWNPLWYWLPGQWVTGQMRPLTWKQRTFDDRHSWAPTLDYEKVSNTIFTASNLRLSLQYRSLALCRYKRISQLLTTISCGCANDYLQNTPSAPQLDCYSNITGVIPVAVSGPCVATVTVSTGPFFDITFTNTSVPNQCVDVTVSQSSVLGFRNPPKTKLSGDFASFQKAQDYDVQNNNKAVIGTVLGDGVVVEVNSNGVVTSMILCLQLSRITYASVSDTYPVLDWLDQQPQMLRTSPHGATPTL